MNLLADESCAGPVVRALRKAGHDLTAIAEIAKGATDEEVLERALNEKRVLITEDLDFGRLVYARGRSTAGVILVRFPNSARGRQTGHCGRGRCQAWLAAGALLLPLWNPVASGSLLSLRSAFSYLATHLCR